MYKFKTMSNFCRNCTVYLQLLHNLWLLNQLCMHNWAICFTFLTCLINIWEKILRYIYKHTAVETWLNPSVGPSLANPKSDNLAFHCSSKSMFEDLKSLKIICATDNNLKKNKTRESVEAEWKLIQWRVIAWKDIQLPRVPVTV